MIDQGANDWIVFVDRDGACSLNLGLKQDILNSGSNRQGNTLSLDSHIHISHRQIIQVGIVCGKGKAFFAIPCYTERSNTNPRIFIDSNE